MNRIEDEYRRRFKNQQLPNDQFDTKDLWDEISEELDQKKKRRIVGGWHKWLLGLLLLLLLTAGFYFIDTNNNRAETLTNNSAIIITDELILDTCLEIVNQAESLSLPNSNPKTITQNRLNSELKNALSLNSNQSINTDLGALPREMDWQVVGINKIDTTTKAADLSAGAFLQQTDQAARLIDTQVSEVNESTATMKEEVDSPQIATFNKDHFNGITGLLPTLSFALDARQPIEKPLVNIEEVGIEEVKTRNRFLGLYSGVNFTHFQFRARTDSTGWSPHQKNDTEKGLWGSSIGLEAGVIVRDKWRIQSGIEYNQLWSKFEYQATSDSLVFKENELLQVVVDNMGNVIDEIYGDTSVATVFTHTIIHHNKYAVLSLPINMGFVDRTKKWTYGLSAGVRLNFLINQTGRTWDANAELIDFDKSAQSVLHNSFSLGLDIRPFLGCQITDQLSLTMKPGWTWQSNKVFDDSNLSVRMQTFHLNIGIQKSFGKDL